MTMPPLTLETICCTTCTLRFALPTDTIEQRKRDGKAYHCPNGHLNTFPKDQDELKLLRRCVHELQDLVDRQVPNPEALVLLCLRANPKTWALEDFQAIIQTEDSDEIFEALCRLVDRGTILNPGTLYELPKTPAKYNSNLYNKIRDYLVSLQPDVYVAPLKIAEAVDAPLELVRIELARIPNLKTAESTGHVTLGRLTWATPTPNNLVYWHVKNNPGKTPLEIYEGLKNLGYAATLFNTRADLARLVETNAVWETNGTYVVQPGNEKTAQQRVFYYLVYRHPEACHYGDIADAIGRSKSAVSTALTLLIREGTVTRTKPGTYRSRKP